MWFWIAMCGGAAFRPGEEKTDDGREECIGL